MPRFLGKQTYITTEKKELLLHHFTIHVNLPCRSCLSPEYPTRLCKVPEDSKERNRLKFTDRVEVTRAAELGDGKRKRVVEGLSRSMA
jgi:hypothetical protein